MGLTKGSGFAVCSDFLSDHGMADEIAGHALGLHQGRLEGEKRKHVIDIPRHLFRAPRTPGPDCGRDIMHRANIRYRLDPLGHAEREIGAVDGDHHIGLGVNDGLRRLVDPRHQGFVFRQDLGDAHDRQFGHIKTAAQPFGGHIRPADPVKGDVGAQGFQP